MRAGSGALDAALGGLGALIAGRATGSGVGDVAGAAGAAPPRDETAQTSAATATAPNAPPAHGSTRLRAPVFGGTYAGARSDSVLGTPLPLSFARTAVSSAAISSAL